VISMKREEREVLMEEFDVWLKTRFADRLRIGGHRFEKAARGEIMIDGGAFTEEEARLLFQMLTSRNPLERINAAIIIWDRNGTLVKIVVALAILALILVYFWVRR